MRFVSISAADGAPVITSTHGGTAQVVVAESGLKRTAAFVAQSRKAATPTKQELAAETAAFRKVLVALIMEKARE